MIQFPLFQGITSSSLLIHRCYVNFLYPYLGLFFSPKKNDITYKPKFQVIFVFFIMLWTPMFLSSLRLTLSNPGFMLDYDPEDKHSKCLKAALILIDLVLFLFHPLILLVKISSLKMQQEAIKKSRDLNKSLKYNENFKKLNRMENQFASYKRLEINLESMFQMMMSLLLYFYATSSTTTTNSLKSVFNEETTQEDKIDAKTLCEEKTLASTFYCQHLIHIPNFNFVSQLFP